MSDRAPLVAAIADQPRDRATRLVFADWLEEQGEPARAELIRVEERAAKLRRGSERRADLLDEAADLLADHEGEWLADWEGRPLDWEFRRGLLRRVRLTLSAFLEHGEALFQREPVSTVELTDDEGEPLDEAGVRAAVEHPAFAFVRDCAVVHDRPYGSCVPLDVWFRSFAANAHVTRLRRFRPVEKFPFEYRPDSRGDGIDEASFATFCTAPHLKSLRSLDLTADGHGEDARPWLIPRLAAASFAGELRSLTLAGCGLCPEGLRRLGGEPAFGNLRRLSLTPHRSDPDGWAELFGGDALTSVNTINVPADVLPAYARSPLARRVRNLTVVCADDLDRDMSADRNAWLELIGSAPPPRRLSLDCHNPGDEVFAAIDECNWLSELRALSISGDSQYEVYAGETAGIRSLFGVETLPRLTTLELHEACDRSVLATLSAWPRLGRLECLELGDDYGGRLVPDAEAAFERPDRLRALSGIVLVTGDHVEQFLAQFRLDRLSRLQLSFAAEHAGSGVFVPQLSAEEMLRVLHSPDLRRVTELTLGFHEMGDAARDVTRGLGDVAVLPRLRRARLYAGFDSLREAAGGLLARLGNRLDVR